MAAASGTSRLPHTHAPTTGRWRRRRWRRRRRRWRRCRRCTAVSPVRGRERRRRRRNRNSFNTRGRGNLLVAIRRRRDGGINLIYTAPPFPIKSSLWRGEGEVSIIVWSMTTRQRAIREPTAFVVVLWQFLMNFSFSSN